MTQTIFFWLIVALLAAIGETLTTGLFLAALAVAAVIVAITALVLPLALQVLLFAGLSLAGIAVFRPIAVHALGLDTIHHLPEPSHLPHIVGRKAIVTQTVNADSGQIRIGSGEFWTARPYELNDSFPTGTPVEVLFVENLTALVAPVETVPAAETPEAADQKGT